jgi:hypothetical protein
MKKDSTYFIDEYSIGEARMKGSSSAVYEVKFVLFHTKSKKPNQVKRFGGYIVTVRKDQQYNNQSKRHFGPYESRFECLQKMYDYVKLNYLW